MIRLILNQYQFNLKYAKALVNDLSETEMTMVPSKGFESHPAWTLGHLVTGAAFTVKYLGGELELDKHWEEIFGRKGPQDQRRPSEKIYPSKNDILKELEKQHLKVESILKDLDESLLLEEKKWRFHSHMPTLCDLIQFMCISHENMHLGQLAAWRRAMDKPNVLDSL